MINKMIEISKGFQSSVNIEYDFNDKKKVDNFIPTNACLEIIDSIISSTEGVIASRAKILTGAYGRGKSLCVLIALSILFNSDETLFKNLIKNIEKLNLDLSKKIKNYIASHRRMLPVIINGNSSSMVQAFLSALQRALIIYQMEDIMPETHFDAAIKTINRWRTDYPETFNEFSNCLEISVDEFIELMSNNNSEAYVFFADLYPKLTAGSVFNPFVNGNVVDIYDNVNSELKRKGFSGIFVVYDEFGKYLESNITTAVESETKMLQDLAEKCNRESSQQLHLMLICHKDISNYIDMRLSQDKIDGWRGISGRFEHINLTNNFSQMYEIISHTIKKDEGQWGKFRKENDSVYTTLYDMYGGSSLFRGKEELVIEQCYPLHPITTFILPRLSERVAQNERTLFTFLSSNQKNTLKQFIEKNTDVIPFITPDYLYDYFENELRKELNASDIHKVYSLSSRILRNFSPSSLAAKVIKCIAVIHFVQQFERLSPVTDVICGIYSLSYDSKEVIDCIQKLINEQYILYRKSSNNFLCLKETSGININSEIQKRTDSIQNKKSAQDIVNECIGQRFLYPTSYNDDMCITRYFEIKFVSSENYLHEIQNDPPYDIAGVVFAVFREEQKDYDDFIEEVYPKLSLYNRHVTIIPQADVEMTLTLSKYLAIKELREEAVGDQVLFEEYSLYLDDYSEIVSNFVMSYISPELHKVSYYYRGEIQKIRRKSQLSGLLSQICGRIYTKTPIINNESLNKERLPGIAINSRTKILTALLEKEVVEENLGLKGTGQDVSFMRSSLLQTNILRSNGKEYYLDLKPKDKNLSYVINVILEFFRSTIQQGEKSFLELYDVLINPAYGIGMKKGIIPIFIAVVLHTVRKDLVFMVNNEEIRLTADLLNAINEQPNLYSVRMENWDDGKSAYLCQLSNIFSEHIIEKEKTFNSFAYIVGAINRWYLSLPKCSREMTVCYDSGRELSKPTLGFVRNLKKPNNNSRDFLLITLKEIYDAKEINNDLALKIKETKEIFDSSKGMLINYIIRTIKETFGACNESSLSSLLSEWYEKLNLETRQHLFANNENTILNLIATVTNDELAFAERIAKAIIGLRVNDWNNATAKVFRDQLINFKKTIEEFDVDKQLESSFSSQQFKMIITDEHGVERIRSFEKVEYSRRANLLYQDITTAIDEIGQSITEQEKRQVLIDILSKLCE